MQYIGICGFKGSGKSTVAKILADEYGFREEQFSDPLKYAIGKIFSYPYDMLLGETDKSREWRETPDSFWSKELDIPKFTPRMALQIVGTNLFRDGLSKNIWCSSMKKRLLNTNDKVVISDVRFIEEIEMIQSLGGKIIFVTRESITPEWAYHSVYDTFNGDIMTYLSDIKEAINYHESEIYIPALIQIYGNGENIVKNNGTIDNIRRSLINMFNVVPRIYTMMNECKIIFEEDVPEHEKYLLSKFLTGCTRPAINSEKRAIYLQDYLKFKERM